MLISHARVWQRLIQVHADGHVVEPATAQELCDARSASHVAAVGIVSHRECRGLGEEARDRDDALCVQVRVGPEKLSPGNVGVQLVLVHDIAAAYGGGARSAPSERGLAPGQRG